MILVAGVVSISTFLTVSAGPAAAENPADILPELADDGVYVASSRVADADPNGVLPVIQRAQTDGVSMSVLWPAEPQPNTSAFARRVQEASGIDVVLVFGPEGDFGSFVAEDYEDGSIRAENAARDR